MINTSTVKVPKRLLPSILKELEYKEKRSQNSYCYAAYMM